MEIAMIVLSMNFVKKIISRLPTFALLGCKWVCKSWFTRIDSPTFIAKHLEVCNSANPNLLVKAYGYYYIISFEHCNL